MQLNMVYDWETLNSTSVNGNKMITILRLLHDMALCRPPPYFNARIPHSLKSYPDSYSDILNGFFFKFIFFFFLWNKLFGIRPKEISKHGLVFKNLPLFVFKFIKSIILIDNY